jgi:hypothetical protein
MGSVTAIGPLFCNIDTNPIAHTDFDTSELALTEGTATQGSFQCCAFRFTKCDSVRWVVIFDLSFSGILSPPLITPGWVLRGRLLHRPEVEYFVVFVFIVVSILVLFLIFLFVGFILSVLVSSS